MLYVINYLPIGYEAAVQCKNSTLWGHDHSQLWQQCYRSDSKLSLLLWVSANLSSSKDKSLRKKYKMCSAVCVGGHTISHGHKIVNNLAHVHIPYPLHRVYHIWPTRGYLQTDESKIPRGKGWFVKQFRGWTQADSTPPLFIKAQLFSTPRIPFSWLQGLSVIFSTTWKTGRRWFTFTP